MSINKPIRHLLGISGGKDSAALAIYMRDKVPEMEYFFSDTGCGITGNFRVCGFDAGLFRQPRFNRNASHLKILD